MNIKQNTTTLEAILAQINNLPEAGAGGITPSGTLEITENGTYDVTNYAQVLVDIAAQNGAIGSFTLSSNLTTSTQTHSVSVGFAPSAVMVFRRTWVKGTRSINAAFSGDFTFSICSAASSYKAVEKLVTSSYITKNSDGFTITGNSTYHWVAGTEYIYVAIP